MPQIISLWKKATQFYLSPKFQIKYESLFLQGGQGDGEKFLPKGKWLSVLWRGCIRSDWTPKCSCFWWFAEILFKGRIDDDDDGSCFPPLFPFIQVSCSSLLCLLHSVLCRTILKKGYHINGYNGMDSSVGGWQKSSPGKTSLDPSSPPRPILRSAFKSKPQNTTIKKLADRREIPEIPYRCVQRPVWGTVLP